MNQEEKDSHFQDGQGFPFMIREGTCSEFQAFHGFPFINHEGNFQIWKLSEDPPL